MTFYVLTIRRSTQDVVRPDDIDPTTSTRRHLSDPIPTNSCCLPIIP